MIHFTYIINLLNFAHHHFASNEIFIRLENLSSVPFTSPFWWRERGDLLSRPSCWLTHQTNWKSNKLSNELSSPRSSRVVQWGVKSGKVCNWKTLFTSRDLVRVLPKYCHQHSTRKKKLLEQMGEIICSFHHRYVYYDAEIPDLSEVFDGIFLFTSSLSAQSWAEPVVTRRCFDVAHIFPLHHTIYMCSTTPTYVYVLRRNISSLSWICVYLCNFYSWISPIVKLFGQLSLSSFAFFFLFEVKISSTIMIYLK